MNAATLQRIVDMGAQGVYLREARDGRGDIYTVIFAGSQSASTPHSHPARSDETGERRANAKHLEADEYDADLFLALYDYPDKQPALAPA